MPVAVADEVGGIEALEAVLEKLNTPAFEKSVKAKESDIAFLSELMNDPVLQSLIEAQDTLEDAVLEPCSCDNIELVKDIVDELGDKLNLNPTAKELRNILCNPHFRVLMEAHDDIAAKNYEDDLEIFPIAPPQPTLNNNTLMSTSPDAIRMVGIRKTEGEPLGITIRQADPGLVVARIMTASAIEKQGFLCKHTQGITVRANEIGELAVSRIMAGSTVDSQGLLHVGDIIKEINGQEVTSPEQLMEYMRKASGSLTLKILPSYYDQSGSSQVFLKTHFSYDPQRDNLIPCRDAGLGFQEGEILQVLNMDDPNWWQAKKVDVNGTSGLVPSQTLEEKRKSFVRPEYDYTHKSLLCGLMTKKKKKLMYQAKQSSEFDRNDIIIYEEVARMPPFQRKTLVLIGAQGVGRRTLKQRLIKADPSRFAGVIPHTTRPIRPGEKEGDAYYFVPRELMDRDLSMNKYLEHGEFDGNLYGTKNDSIRQVIRAGRMCILDLNPQALKAIKTSEYMPYVVFIAAPPVDIMRNMHEYARMQGKTDKYKTERDFRQTLDESADIEKHYKNFFDLVIVNDNANETYNKLRKAIETLSTEPQWVPVSWVY